MKMAITDQFFKIFKNCFTVACTITALYLCISCIYMYILDKDTSFVNFKDFHSDASSLYPSATLCFDRSQNIFDTKLGNPFNNGYIKFLSGCITGDNGNKCDWNASYADVSYDNLTINLLDYVIGELTIFADGTDTMYVYKKFPEKRIEIEDKYKTVYGYRGGKRVYTSSRMWKQKCLTFDMPFEDGKKIKYHSILLNNSVFNGKIRPMGPNDFKVLFHYPNQFTRQTTGKDIWNDVNTLLNKPCPWRSYDGSEKEDCVYYNSTYTMTFDVENVSVLKRRNKNDAPCIENWRNDDNELKSQISKTLNCKPNHWNLPLNLSHCKTQEQMTLSLSKEENPTVPSCYSIERYSFLHNDRIGLDNFDLGVSAFNDTFGIDWNTESMANEIVSELIFIFGGKCI